MSDKYNDGSAGSSFADWEAEQHRQVFLDKAGKSQERAVYSRSNEARYAVEDENGNLLFLTESMLDAYQNKPRESTLSPERAKRIDELLRSKLYGVVSKDDRTDIDALADEFLATFAENAEAATVQKPETTQNSKKPFSKKALVLSLALCAAIVLSGIMTGLFIWKTVQFQNSYSNGYDAGHIDGYKRGYDAGENKPVTTPKPTPNPTPTPKPTLAPVLIANGEIVKGADGESLAPFTVEASGDVNYYIYLDCIDTGVLAASTTRDFGFYVSKGKTANLHVPLGKYKLYYATGSIWYGAKNIFGDSTVWYSSDDVFDFYYDGSSYQGWTVTLYPVPNGNMQTELSEPPIM
ncbi:MAG: hypothetical protein LBN00_04785 [Oscillospiraceae bacterium]|jgi:hypothetical protein|nr:hypothetical protein [Oscillospiraceae bacterium]